MWRQAGVRWRCCHRRRCTDLLRCCNWLRRRPGRPRSMQLLLLLVVLVLVLALVLLVVVRLRLRLLLRLRFGLRGLLLLLVLLMRMRRGVRRLGWCYCRPRDAPLQAVHFTDDSRRQIPLRGDCALHLRKNACLKICLPACRESECLSQDSTTAGGCPVYQTVRVEPGTHPVLKDAKSPPPAAEKPP
jgi:hypothetical protein